MTTLNHQKESLTRAYIQAVAARCGVTCSHPDHDYGIDLHLHEIAQRRDGDRTRFCEGGASIAIQAKSTTTASVTLDDVEVAYDLEVKSYNDLRIDVIEPRLLVLLVLPLDEAQWVNVTEEQLILRRCVYWMSLKGMPPTENSDKIRIQIPRSNVFSVEALRDLMQRRKNGDDL